MSTFFYQMHPFITLLAGISFFFAIKNRDIRHFAILSGIVILLATGVMRTRYLIIAYPALTLLAAYGLYHLKTAEIQNHILIGILAVSFSITIVANKRFLTNTSGVNLQSAGAYLDTLPERRVLVYAMEQPSSAVNPDIAVPLLDYYTHKSVYVDDQMNSPGAPGNKDTSPVRFTWEYHMFPYPKAEDIEDKSNVAIALITHDGRQRLPEHLRIKLADYRLDRQFGRNDIIFRYQTVVSVYRYRNNV